MQNYTTQEPIYALATSYSPSALAVIRASGDGVLSLFAPCFKGRLLSASTNQAVHGYIIDKSGRKVDEVVVIRYDKGHGYTSEEAFEIMSHGSLAVIKGISAVLEALGFRKALKGEFTYRAFMHGRMDLTEAEAVEELVKARTEKASSSALDRLSGSIKNEADLIKKDIVDILASLEVQLDYGEDEILEDWVFPEEKVGSIIDRLERIRDTYSASRLYSEGASVVLAGRTNAGKSSLFNALLKENRAIVSSVAGTTRDYLEVQAEIEGIPVRLFDTAGLRSSSDEIEAEGIKRSESLMESADLILYVLDGDEKIEDAIEYLKKEVSLENGEREGDFDRKKILFLHSKADLKRQVSAAEGGITLNSLQLGVDAEDTGSKIDSKRNFKMEGSGSESESSISDGSKEEIWFSSKTGEGISDVTRAIAQKLTEDIDIISEVPQIDSERQRNMLSETIDALKDARKAKGMSVDIIALYFQSALSSLAYLTGEVTNDDILDVLFSSFCLGK